MERLVEQGVMFTQAYVNSISSPTRRSLITGMNAVRHRVTNWIYPKGQQTGRPSGVFNVADQNVNGVCQVPSIDHTFQTTSLVEVLKDSGYHIIHCGKAYFGAVSTPGEGPYHIGSGMSITGHIGNGLASYLGKNSYGNRTDGKPNPWFAVPGLDKYWGADTLVSKALTPKAIETLNHAKGYDQSFFLYTTHYATHVPVDKDKHLYQKYIDKRLTPKEATYAVLIEGMGKGLGDLMDWLDRSGEADSTIAIFTSDNGGLSDEPGWCDGKLHAQNSPFSSGKGSAHEGDVRKPMIVRWPGVVRPDTKCGKHLIIGDFYSSALEMAQVKHYKAVQSIDGISLIPLLEQADDLSRGRNLYWNSPNHWDNDGPGIGPTCTVCRGDRKLIYYYKNGEKELFNIPQDIGEKNSLVAQYSGIVKHLPKDLDNYLRKAGGQRSSFEATKKPRPWPNEIR